MSLLVATIFWACDSNGDNIDNIEKDVVDMVISVDNSSRVSYGDNFSLSFADSDELMVMEESLGDVTSLKYSDGQFFGKVYVPRVADGSYSVCGALGADKVESGSATYSILSNQSGYASVKLAGKSLVSDYSNVQLGMEQVFSMLSISVNPLESGIYSLILESIAGEAIVGEATYHYSTGEVSVNGDASKIIVTPIAPITKAQQVIFNILPVELSEGLYLTLVDKYGKRMRLTLNYGNSLNFEKNKVVVIPNVINQSNINIELGTTYSSYMINGVTAPNNSLDGSTIWIAESKALGISGHLIKEAGLYVDGEKYSSAFTTDGVISGMTLYNQRWANHEIQAYVIDNENNTYLSEKMDVAVTGLPYSVSFAGVSESSLSNTLGFKHSSLTSIGGDCITMTQNGYLTTKTFYVPNLISVVTSVSNTTNDNTAGNQIVYATPVTRDMLRTITGGAMITANYNGDYNPGSGNCVMSALSSPFNLTNEKNCVQYATPVNTVWLWQECVMAISEIVIKYAE